MKTKTIGFVGGGRITRVFLDGWTRAERLPALVTVSDPNSETLARLKSRFPMIQTTGDNTLAAAADVVFLAVHPPIVAETLAAIKGALQAHSILVSLAPKFTLARMRELLGGFSRLARSIPNAPSMIGRGFNPVTLAPELAEPDQARLAALFEPLGEHPEVAEETLEVYAIVSAMGPTYLWFQLQALREAATGFGLSDGEAARAIQAMTSGASQTLFASGLTAAEVLDLIPVKPLAEMETQVSEMYRTRLPAIYAKIKP